MENLLKRVRRLLQNKHVKYGIPFISLIFLGSFGLREFTSLKYEFRKTELLDPKSASELGIQMKPKGSVTLESEYEKIKEIDIDNWENIRGPRLYDETPQMVQ